VTPDAAFTAPGPTDGLSESKGIADSEDHEAVLSDVMSKLEELSNAKHAHDQKKGAEGEKGHPDCTDELLAEGFESLLRTISALLGPKNNPGVMVSFKDLSYRAKTYEGTDVVATYGSQIMRLLTFWQFWRHHRTADTYVLNNLTGSFRPGTTTLVLGPPQSGKSSLMKALSGRLVRDGRCTLEGTVLHAGRDLTTHRPAKGEILLSKITGYISQLDNHIPTLTLRETVNYARGWTSHFPKKLAATASRPGDLDKLMAVDDLVSEIVMSMLGIRHVGDTICGNERIRGVSGGQRKRLTSAEIMVTRTPVLFADEISTGLDSATTYDICSALRTSAKVMRRVVVVSLLQPTPETFGTFDDVLVMVGGHIAYHGPRELALKYFAQLGFECPPTMDAAEFLQEVTLPTTHERYIIPGKDVPRSSEEFGMAWRNSPLLFKRTLQDEALEEESRRELDALPRDGVVHHRLSTRHVAPFGTALLLCLKREVKLTLRNLVFLRATTIQTVVIGFLLGSLFFQIAFLDGNGKFAVINFCQLFLSISGLALIPGMMKVRPIVYRQLEADFYGVVPYTVAVAVTDVPITIVQCLIFVIIVYFMCGFTYTFTNWICFVTMMCLVKMAMGMFFKAVAMLMPNEVAGQGFASLWILLFSIHSGYIVGQGNVKPWWVWVYWIDPLQYGMTSLSQLEFLQSDRYQVLYSSASSLTTGEYLMESKQMPTASVQFLAGYIYVAGFYVLMSILFAVVLRFVKWKNRFPPTPADRPVKEVARPEAGEVQFTPCTLAWEDVVYDVNDPGKKGKEGKLGLRLLSGVSGFAKPNTMTALMGTSGAGKTTLLDVLAGRKNTGKIGGKILLNGQEADPVTFSRYAGYVEQMDIHTPTATVAEALRFSAFLRLPRDMPKASKEAFVWEVIRMLKLEREADLLIGTKEHGLSVEQVKRVTIGVEMAANPAVIFLDEPTSGLDSIAANTVVDAIKAVTNTGRTIICTIHQPSSSLFNHFDSLYLMIRGGRTVYFGPLGENCATLVRYFEGVQTIHRHDGRSNPATWMLTVVGVEGVDFPEQYKASDLCVGNVQELQTLMQEQSAPLKSGHRYQASVLTQFRCLFQKWILTHWRSPQYNFTRTMLCIIIALIMGSIFWQQTNGTTQQDIFSVAGAIFMSFVFVGVTFQNTVQGITERERTVYYREKAANMYHPFFLNIVAGICELPYLTLNTIVFTSIFYWMVGLNGTAGAFFFYYLIFWLYISFSTFFGFLLGCLLPNAELATGAGGAFVSISSLLCGFMQPVYLIGWWWRWLYYCIPLTYAFQAATSNQFYCAAAAANPSSPGSCPTFPQTINGASQTVAVWTFVEHYFSLHYPDRWMYVGLLFMFVGLCRIGSGFALSFVNHDKR